MKQPPCAVRRRFEQYSEDWPPENAAGFMAWFEDRLAEIPEDCRQTASIEIDADVRHGAPLASLEIVYFRTAAPARRD